MSWSILEFLRKNPEELKNNLKRRAIDVSLVDKAVELDKKWRQVLQEVERLRHQHNVLSSQIPKLSGEERKKKIEESKNLLKILEDKEKELEKIEVERDRLLSSLPNLVADDVPNGPDDSYNIPIKFWGKFKVYEGDVEEFLRQTKDANVNYEIIKWKPKGHAEMLEDVLHLGNTLKAAEIAGSRFYYLFNDIVWLDFALLLFAIDYITQHGYTLVLPPYMLRGEVIQSVST